MADGGRESRDERTSIGVLIKSHKKYGSVANHVKRNEVYVKHNVLPEDTLQGIALKYGVTTEQIRRVNRIWTNDSLFLRKTLDIPMPKDSLNMFVLDNGDSSPTSSLSSSSTGEDVAASSARNMMLDSNLVTECGDAISDRQAASEQTVADILVRIDSTIALTKNKVRKMESTHESAGDPTGDSHLLHQQFHGLAVQQSLMRALSEPNVSPHPLVMSRGRKVRTSLQRLEREQDELFEL